jgi:hypothetical protein
MPNVRGALFADYVRMIRGHKRGVWGDHLRPADMAFLSMRIEPNEWYPMESFERLGNAILHVIAGDDLEAVRAWGRYSVAQLRALHPELLAPHDPVETLARFQVLRRTFFDFEALEVPLLHEDEAQVVIRYHMGMPAEEAACVQTQGFFEGLLAMAGATSVTTRFVERSWAGGARTVLAMRWEQPRRSPR